MGGICQSTGSFSVDPDSIQQWEWALHDLLQLSVSFLPGVDVPRVTLTRPWFLGHVKRNFVMYAEYHEIGEEGFSITEEHGFFDDGRGSRLRKLCNGFRQVIREIPEIPVIKVR